MKNSLQLLGVLHSQLDACKNYLDLQNKKTKTLVNGDIKELDTIVRSEQSYIMKMESYESKREKLIAEDDLVDVTLSFIISDYVEDEYKDQYREVFDELTNTIFELKRVNSLNQKLLKQRLSVVNYIMDNPVMSEYLSGGKTSEKGNSKFSNNKSERA